jgi:hypothetical protein
VIWDDAAIQELEHRYGVELAADLLDLGTLYKSFEDRSGYPWLICTAAVDEAGLLRGPKGERLRQLIDFLLGHQDDWSNDAYPGIAQGLLFTRERVRVSPLILKALKVKSVEEVHDASGPLRFLADRGDRLVAAQAILANIPVVMTTDRKTFWAKRERLADLGLLVMRPGELLRLYEPYWQALESEFVRRRADDRIERPRNG